MKFLNASKAKLCNLIEYRIGKTHQQYLPKGGYHEGIGHQLQSS
jgi:hypothetical protein